MIIVSPDRFPPLSPAQAAAAIAPVVGGTAFPLIDAHLGTSSHFAGERITLPTTSATGRLTEATYTYNADITTAFIDMAAASGEGAGCDPRDGDSYGTGVLIADAVARGAPPSSYPPEARGRTTSAQESLPPWARNCRQPMGDG